MNAVLMLRMRLFSNRENEQQVDGKCFFSPTCYIMTPSLLPSPSFKMEPILLIGSYL